MSIFQALLISTFFLLIVTPEMCQSKILDFNSDNALFHPFVQKIRNYRSKDYLIKLLKRNMEQKLRRYRKLCEAKRENERCHCQNFGKRCPECHSHSGSTEPFVCQKEGPFAKPGCCKKFYLCFRNEKTPIEVTCPTGYAFDSAEGKCTRKAARKCVKKTDVDLQN